ncbi:MAG: hypothetical protein HFJ55_01245 [Clostridia bacterium]|jgi:hypothetical protein|nr:hypothetical protein [Clostridia bacterium]
MNGIDTLWKKDELEQRTVQIEDELYEQLVNLSENEFDASVSKIINACIYEFADKEEIRMSEIKNLSKHSVIFRKSSIEKLIELKSKFSIPQYIILNLAIKEGIEKAQKELK